MSDLVKLLRESPMFDEFSDANLGTLTKAMVEREYDTGDVIIREGVVPGGADPAMFVILSGQVLVTRRPRTSDDDVSFLHLMKPGEIFGLVALIEAGPRVATCRAVEPVRAASITRNAFDLLYRSSMLVADRFQYAIARQLAQDVRSANRHLEQALQGGSRRLLVGRLAKS